MPVEIEYKFLVASEGWRDEVTSSSTLQQGYLSDDIDRTVRVRLVDGTAGYLTIKGRRVGATRPEFEYAIPPDHAAFLLEHLCLRPLIAKERHALGHTSGRWTVDVFADDNEGLVLAEVEVEREGLRPELPDWVGIDVTADDRYANSSLHKAPYRSWS